MESQQGPTRRPVLLPSATRALYSSLPFDSGKAILFLPERGAEDNECERPSWDRRRRNTEKVEELNGQEAKQFYEEVLSMPEEMKKRSSSVVKSKHPISRHARSRKRKSKRTINKNGLAKNPESFTVGQLFRFAQEGNLEDLQSALSCGLFDIDMVDSFNWTLLMSASHAGHMSVVKYLLDLGARWESITDKCGNDAVDLARLGGHPDIATFIELFRAQHYDEYWDSRQDRKRSRLSEGCASHSNGAIQSPEPFFCDICKMRVDVQTSSRDRHDTSTVHQFSCQHHPNVTSYGLSESNRGYQMLVKGGWDPEKGLGSEKQGQKFPVKTVLKQDRLGFGLKGSSSKPRVTHFSAHDEDAVRTHSQRGGGSHGEKKPPQRKKDIVRDVEKDKRWEMKMRRYMNSDYDVY